MGVDSNGEIVLTIPQGLLAHRFPSLEKQKETIRKNLPRKD